MVFIIYLGKMVTLLAGEQVSSSCDLLPVVSLTSEQRVALKDHVPAEVASVVFGLTDPQRDLIYGTLGFRNFSAYNRDQRVWKNDCEWYLGFKLHRHPNELEIAEDMLSNGNHQRYRLCHLAMHPEQTDIRPSATQEGLELAERFFETIREVYWDKRDFDRAA